MKLNPQAFDLIKAGVKTLELRLFDEKRKKLELGDFIIFSKLPENNEKLRAKICGLLRYSSFSELLDDIDMHLFGSTDDMSKEDFISSMRKFYSEEDEKKYGVLAISLSVIR